MSEVAINVGNKLTGKLAKCPCSKLTMIEVFGNWQTQKFSSTPLIWKIDVGIISDKKVFAKRKKSTFFFFRRNYERRYRKREEKTKI